MAITQLDCKQLDAQDPLAHFREAFILPEDRLNFDGNSLGSLPKATVEKMQDVLHREWGRDLIASWSQNGWFDAPVRVGNKLSQLIGAAPGEVIITDSVSVNIFKALCAAISLNPGRRIMLSESGNFPTDLYMMEGMAQFSQLLGWDKDFKVAKQEGNSPDFANDKIRLQNKVVAPAEVLHHLTEEVAVLLLTQVHYKTAVIKDIASITAKAKEKGILTIWDLSHSVGSIPVDLHVAGVDFAVGCGYKFLNGGPGAPGFLFVAERHQARALPILSGWMGHHDPFAFTDDYQAAANISRFRVGTPPILSLSALESGIDLILQAD
ncbi:MAG: aminotransferase class V-fold PLP-dependent enzyme, partial [Bacteroidota bacterium]